MNPLDARESEETYEYPARPYTLPMRPVQTFRVLSESGDVPTAQTTGFNAVEDWEWTPEPDLESLWGWAPWSDKYLTAEDARVLRQDGM